MRVSPSGSVCVCPVIVNSHTGWLCPMVHSQMPGKSLQTDRRTAMPQSRPIERQQAAAGSSLHMHMAAIQLVVLLSLLLATALWQLLKQRSNLRTASSAPSSPEAPCAAPSGTVDISTSQFAEPPPRPLDDIEDLGLPTAARRPPSTPSAARAPPFGPHEGAPLYLPAGIRVVHLEVSTKCNAACPQCPRNVRGGRDNPALPLVDLSLAQVKLLVDPGATSLAGLRKIFLCGNYGDPTAARDCLAIVRGPPEHTLQAMISHLWSPSASFLLLLLMSSDMCWDRYGR